MKIVALFLYLLLSTSLFAQSSKVCDRCEPKLAMFSDSAHGFVLANDLSTQTLHLFTSNNGGYDWHDAGSELPLLGGASSRRALISPEPSVVFFFNNEFRSISTDRGTHWSTDYVYARPHRVWMLDAVHGISYASSQTDSGTLRGDFLTSDDSGKYFIDTLGSSIQLQYGPSSILLQSASRILILDYKPKLRKTSVRRSLDSARSWEVIDLLEMSDSTIPSYFLKTTGDTVILASFGRYDFLMSTNFGLSWTEHEDVHQSRKQQEVSIYGREIWAALGAPATNLREEDLLDHPSVFADSVIYWDARTDHWRSVLALEAGSHIFSLRVTQPGRAVAFVERDTALTAINLEVKNASVTSEQPSFDDMRLFPNPLTGNDKLRILTGHMGPASIDITDVLGRIHYTTQTYMNGLEISIPLPASLSVGSYLVEVQVGGHRVGAKQFVKF